MRLHIKNAEPRIWFESDTAQTWQIGNMARAGHGYSYVIRDQTAATDRLMISENGNVGIGTMDPENKLHVNGAINLDPVAEPTTPTTGFVLYIDTADGDLKAKFHNGTITTIAAD